MKIKPADIDRFLARPPQGLAVALLFGPDEGLSRERASRIASAVVADPHDPFRVVSLSEEDLKGDPARLADEFASLALTGGRRLIRIRTIGEHSAAALAELLAGIESGAVRGDALVIIEAGDLKSTSPLRRQAESARCAAAIASYGDDVRSLRQVALHAFAEKGLSIDADALALLIAELGNDRAVTRQEIEKLALLKRGGAGRVTVEDVASAIASSNALGVEDVCYAAASGDMRRLDDALTRCFFMDVAPVALVRALIRHFERLESVAVAVAAGADRSSAIDALRPPVHFRRSPELAAQAGRWSAGECRRALGRLYHTEIACKTTGLPAELICRRAALALAEAA